MQGIGSVDHSGKSQCCAARCKGEMAADAGNTAMKSAEIAAKVPNHSLAVALKETSVSGCRELEAFLSLPR